MTNPTTTKIVVGRVPDGSSSEAESITAELFHSIYDTPVKLENDHLVSGTVVVDNPENGNFVENVDYSIDYEVGTITVIDGGDMLDDHDYYIDYDFKVAKNLAYKVQQVIDSAASVVYVLTAKSGERGVAVIIYTPT